MQPGGSPANSGGEASVSSGVEFDLSDGYNRIADIWYPLFVSATQQSMPIAACAYPVNVREQTIAFMREQVLPEDYFLRWEMAMATDDPGTPAEYHLYCNWQGFGWDHDGGSSWFIENAVGWVDWLGGAAAEQLVVQVAFGRPQFVDGVATMAAEFIVDESRGGSLARRANRPFRIRGDGGREKLF
jgi:hypothetical protein